MITHRMAIIVTVMPSARRCNCDHYFLYQIDGFRGCKHSALCCHNVIAECVEWSCVHGHRVH